MMGRRRSRGNAHQMRQQMRQQMTRRSIRRDRSVHPTVVEEKRDRRGYPALAQREVVSANPGICSELLGRPSACRRISPRPRAGKQKA